MLGYWERRGRGALTAKPSGLTAKMGSLTVEIQDVTAKEQK
ncbi:hypothetical protein [Ectobacillus polymachus]